MSALKRFLPWLLVLAGVALLVGAGYRWGAGNVQAKWDADKAKQAAAALTASEQARKTEQTWQTKSAAIDKKYQEELTYAQKENADLQRRLAAGADRVYVRVANCAGLPGAATTAGGTHAAATAELDPAVAADLAGIANDGDDAIRQLTALQEWVREVGRGN